MNPAAFENSRPAGTAVLEIVEDPDPRSGGGPSRFVPLKRTELTGEICGPVATVRLTHLFGYTRDLSSSVLEAVYRFPLPGDAAVIGVRVSFGEVEIHAQLVERGQAEADYAEAKRLGRQAALLTRETPDVFTLQVAGIQPDVNVTIETRYVQLAQAEGTGWSMRVPLTTAPRYVRSDELGSRQAQGQPLLLLRDPGHRFALDLTVEGAASVASPTHRLAVTDGDGGRLRVGLQDAEIIPDRDFVLSWQPRQESNRASLQVLLHAAPPTQDLYFLAMVTPPAIVDPERAVPREIVLLVDHSGSMEGAKWQAADWAVKQFLAQLTPRDAFALGLFHNETRWLSDAPMQADERNRQHAIRFLEQHRDSGGTELGVALEQALSLARSSGERARHVIVITDAQVSDADRILRLAGQEAGRASRRRISVLCIDAAPNSFLVRELVERGGGVARFLTSAPDENDITTALDEILGDWAAPVLVGARLAVNRAEAYGASRQKLPAATTGWSELDLGDLPAGRTIWVAGRAEHDTTSLDFRLTNAGGQEVAAWRPDPAVELGGRAALMALFGARRVLELESLTAAGYDAEELAAQLARLGYSPDDVLGQQEDRPQRIYAENLRPDAPGALRKLLAREALYYGIACSETAFIAMRTEAGSPVGGTVAVANALPAGWSGRFLSRAVARSPMAFSIAPEASVPMSHGSADAAVAPPSTSMPARLSRWWSGASASSSRPAAPTTVVFSGVPRLVGGQAVLFDSTSGLPLPEDRAIERLVVRFSHGQPDPSDLDGQVSVLVFVDDLVAPRARMLLVDVVRQGGERPLNVLRRAGQTVCIMLLDPAGAWARTAPRIEVALGWALE